MPQLRFLRAAFVLAAALALGSGPAYAQQSPGGTGGGVLSGANAATDSRARASRVPRAPVVDGDVLGDTAYEDAPVATGFSQNRPDEGRPASDRTEVRIVYTDDTLYFGVVCYTRDPGTIIVADSRPRLAVERHGQLPDHPGHVPGPAERLRIRHQSGRHRVRRAGIERRPGQRTHGRRRGAAAGSQQQRGSARGLQRQLGRRMAGGSASHGSWVGTRGVRHPVPHAALSGRLLPDVGASTSSATSGTATSARSGRRCRASST